MTVGWQTGQQEAMLCPFCLHASAPGIPARFLVFSLLCALKGEWDSKQALSVVREEARAPGQPVGEHWKGGKVASLPGSFFL